MPNQFLVILPGTGRRRTLSYKPSVAGARQDRQFRQDKRTRLFKYLIDNCKFALTWSSKFLYQELGS